MCRRAPWAPGHTDPRSTLDAGALAGVLAAKHVTERHGLRGALRFSGSQAIHTATGHDDGLDVSVPPIDLPWPEDVETALGREWCLPIPATSGAGIA